jgi:hypothetical protein
LLPLPITTTLDEAAIATIRAVVERYAPPQERDEAIQEAALIVLEKGMSPEAAARRAIWAIRRQRSRDRRRLRPLDVVVPVDDEGVYKAYERWDMSADGYIDDDGRWVTEESPVVVRRPTRGDDEEPDRMSELRKRLRQVRKQWSEIGER